MTEMRKFETGATRDADTSKPDYEGFLSPLALARFAQYMHKNRVQADGKLRDSDNWQKGIPKTAYMKSAFRHFVEWWTAHRAAAPAEYLPGGIVPGQDDLVEEAICALLFNAMGYLHEHLKAKQTVSFAALKPPVAGPEQESQLLSVEQQMGGIKRKYQKLFPTSKIVVALTAPGMCAVDVTSVDSPIATRYIEVLAGYASGVQPQNPAPVVANGQSNYASERKLATGQDIQ